MRLERADHSAEVTSHGRLSSWQVGGVELIAGHSGPGGQDGSRSALLAPWPNRLYLGRWSWRDRDLELPLTKGDYAIHGLVADTEFTIVTSSAESVTMAHDLAPSPGYPFSLRIQVRYTMVRDGMACALEAENTGSEPAPVGLGVHPYLAGFVNDLQLSVPPVTRVDMDQTWHESGRRPWSHDGPIGDLVLDSAFTDLPSGFEIVVTRTDGVSIAVWGGPTCRWLLVFTADTLGPADVRQSLAVEPMTCPPNALATGEIDVLEPGGRLTLDWGFALR